MKDDLRVSEATKLDISNCNEDGLLTSTLVPYRLPLVFLAVGGETELVAEISVDAAAIGLTPLVVNKKGAMLSV